MSMRIEDVRAWILGIVLGIVLIVSGFVVTNVLYSIGNYVVTTVGQSVNATQTQLVTAQQINIVGLALMMSGITLVIFSVAMMIRVIMSSLSNVGQ